jgi:hypothetical protein
MADPALIAQLQQLAGQLNALASSLSLSSNDRVSSFHLTSVSKLGSSQVSCILVATFLFYQTSPKLGMQKIIY